MSLSTRESLFISLLFSQERPTLTAIARELGITKEMATYLYAKLERKGILKGIFPIINYQALGFGTYRLLIKLAPDAFSRKKEIIQTITRMQHVSWVIDIDGPHDIAVLFLVKDAVSFGAIYDTICLQLKKEILRVEVHLVQSITHKLPFANKYSWTCTTSTHTITTIDELDMDIIKLLLAGKWKSLLTIAQELHVTFNTIKHRVQTLEKAGVICGYKPQIDYAKLGLQHIKVMIDCVNLSQTDILKTHLLQTSAVTYLTHTIGQYDLEFECETQSIDDVVAIINAAKQKIAIASYQIYFTNKEVVIGGIGK